MMKDDDRMSSKVQIPRILTSLHTDVLSQILVHVNNTDLLTVMLSCKTLYFVIMTRQFWYNRIDRLRKEYFVSPPEEEMEEYTIPELGRWTMRRIRARCNLPTKLQLRRQCVAMLHLAGCRMKLMPGGRWLLAFGYDKPIYFFDLDSNDFKHDILIDFCQVDPRPNKERGTEHLWIDHKAPRLSFRFAHSFLDQEDGLYFSWVHIHHVDLVGHGASATLVAQSIGTFRGPKERGIPISYALNARHFIQTQESRSRDNTTGIKILDYTPTLGCLHYPFIDSHTLQVGSDVSNVKSINENILLIVRTQSISLYAWDAVSPTLLQPLQTFWFPNGPNSFSRIRWTPEASVFTFTESNGDFSNDFYTTIYGLVTPHDSESRAWTVKLGELRGSLAGLRLGIFNSLIYDRKGGLVRVAQEWDIRSPDGDVLPLEYLQQMVDAPLIVYRYQFDEDTGRSVHLYKNTISVVDMVNGD